MEEKRTYEGMVEEAPEDIKLLKYSKIQTTDKVNFYVEDFNFINIILA